MLTTNDYEIIMDCINIEMHNLESQGAKGCLKWKQLRSLYSKVRIEQLKANPTISSIGKIIESIK